MFALKPSQLKNKEPYAEVLINFIYETRIIHITLTMFLWGANTSINLVIIYTSIFEKSYIYNSCAFFGSIVMFSTDLFCMLVCIIHIHMYTAPSARGDLEILAYCLLQWSSGCLPWDQYVKNEDKDSVADMKIR